MAKRDRELMKNTFILGLGQVIPKIISLVILPILTRYLTTQEYGIYDFIISIASLLIPLMTLQIQQGTFRYLMESNSAKEKKEYITNSIVFSFVSSLLIFIIVGVGCMVFGYGEYSLLVAALYFFETGYNMCGQVVRGLGSNLKYSIGAIVYAVVNCLAIIVTVVILKGVLYGVLFSLVCAYFCADIFLFVSSKMYNYITLKSLNKGTLYALLKFSIPIVPSSISLWVVNFSDRILIIKFLGASANGIYSVSNKIPVIYSTAFSVFNLAWTETATNASTDDDYKSYYSSMFEKLYSFLIGIMLLLLTITPIIFYVLVDKSFEQAYYQVPILYFGIFFNSIVNFYSGIYIALKYTKSVGYSSLAGALINIVINLALIKYIGLFAASISTAISYMIIMLYRWRDINKRIHLSYNYKLIFLSLLLFIISAVFCYMRSIFGMIVCLILGVFYNFKYNKVLFLIINKVLKKGEIRNE